MNRELESSCLGASLSPLMIPRPISLRLKAIKLRQMTMTAQNNFIITGTAQTPKLITGTAHCGILGQSGCHPRMEKYFLIGQFTSIN
jgi:hypothetical protein